MEVFQERQAADNEKTGKTEPNCWFSEWEVQWYGVRGGEEDSIIHVPEKELQHTAVKSKEHFIAQASVEGSFSGVQAKEASRLTHDQRVKLKDAMIKAERVLKVQKNVW